MCPVRTQVRQQGVRAIAIAAGDTLLPLLGGALVGITWSAPFAVPVLALPLAALGWRWLDGTHARVSEPTTLRQCSPSAQRASASPSRRPGSCGSCSDQRATFVAAAGAVKNLGKFTAPTSLSLLVLVMPLPSAFVLVAIAAAAAIALTLPLPALDSRLKSAERDRPPAARGVSTAPPRDADEGEE